jgi:hypothetical protein
MSQKCQKRSFAQHGPAAPSDCRNQTGPLADGLPKHKYRAGAATEWDDGSYPTHILKSLRPNEHCEG